MARRAPVFSGNGAHEATAAQPGSVSAVPLGGRLAGKVALITGADTALGRAVAQRYAREGAAVVLIGPSGRDEVGRAERILQQEGRPALVLMGDVGDGAFCRQVVGDVIDRLGRIDVLVNLPPGPESPGGSDEDRVRAFWARVFGYFSMTRAVLPFLRPGAAIINHGSPGGPDGPEANPGDLTSGGTVAAFTRSLARQLLERQVRVNAVVPGPVAGPKTGTPPDDANGLAWRVGQPEDLVPAYVFLASNYDSLSITGKVLLFPEGLSAA